MKVLVSPIGLSLCLATPTALLAGADCPKHPKEQWMSRSDMQAMILELGYTIDRFKIDDNCYEIYGRNAEDKKVEVYFDPVTGEIVKEEVGG